MAGNLLAALRDASRKLSIPELELRIKVETVVAMRDSLDHYVTGPIYTHFLKEMMPCFILILRQPPVFQTSTPDHLLNQKLRNCVLEVFHRLPSSQPAPPEPFADYAAEAVDLLMGLVRTDNEENAVLCIKILSDIMRHQHKVLGDKVQTFLSLIQEIFEHLEKVVREQLDSTSSSGPPGAPSTPGSSTQASLQQSPRPGSPIVPGGPDFGNEPGHHAAGRPLIKGMLSFKVLAECPIVVVSLFQVNRTAVIHNVKLFVPLIKSVLCCQAKAQEQAHKEALARNTIHYGVSPAIKNRTGFNDFIVAQVKTMSFLAYLLRQYSQQLSDFLPTLPSIIVRLLKDCPREKSASRKELIVAIRHIVNFNFRKIFLRQIEDLLDERILLGDGLTVSETIKPLAYSTVADLIHHVRDSLSTAQIRKTVEVYTRNLFSEFPGTSFQTMTAKLLLNMAECVAKLPNKVDARHYLVMILNAIADKFVAMNKEYPNAVKLSKIYEKQIAEGHHDTYLAEKEDSPEWDETDIFQAMPIKMHNPRERNADPVGDNKFLLKVLLNGLKSTFYQLKSCNPQPVVELANPPSYWADVACGFSTEEVKVIVKLFREGAHVFRYYEIEKPAAEFPYMTTVEYMANFYMTSSSKEEKDLLETFATVFHCIDPATFHEVFQQEIPRLYDMIHEHTALLHIPQFFLASEAASPSFCGMLMRFLMEHIEDVGSADVRRSAILLRLFKLAFMAVTLFASHNEQVLLPHVVDILTKSIQLSTTAEEPLNYFVLLRSLFRSIGGGKFEHLYKNILPLLEMLLDVLNTQLMAARRPWERDLYVELCLTVPARLSNLLPHLSLLMRPLVVALRAGNDLVGQGLRTLELCVDNLTADYLDPIMAPVIDELMAALFDHLRPYPYIHIHAHTTLRILGKLGGRNRKFMTDAPPVAFQPYADDRSSFDIRLIGSKSDRTFPAHLGIDLAISKLMEVPRPGKGTTNATPRQYDPFYKRQALHLIKAQIKLRVGFDNLPEDLPRLVRLQVQDLVARSSAADFSSLERSERRLSIAKRDEEATLLKRLLKALMFARTFPEFKADADAFILNLARHFTVVEVGRALLEMKKSEGPFDVNAGEGPLFIESKVLVDALLESMASDHPDVREGAQRVIKDIYDSAVVIFGSPHHVARLNLFSNLCSAFCHGCYEEDWYTKMGGAAGLRTLLEDMNLGDAWIASKQSDLVKALMFVVKDMPQDLPEKTRRSAQITLEILLTRITKDIKKEDCLPVSVPPMKQSRLSSICAHMNLELPHANKHVRETAQRSLELIAKAAGAQVWELLEPHRKSVLQPIYAKPLRALPFAHQISFIDAVTYYMSLKPDFVPFDGDLNRLLTESLALADANDDSLSGKVLEQRVRQSIVNLRVSCIRILSCAMQSEEFSKGTVNFNAMRSRSVQVFFKCLYMDSKPTIQAANEAIRRVVSLPTKLPKELLQTALRPVLTSLQDVKRLNVATLDNLAILLRLLTNYFKVEIGARLLEQVLAIGDHNLLPQLSFTYFEQHGSMKLIVAAFNVFHLLPDGAEQFMDRLINVALDMEDKLRRTHHSPMRVPLYMYLTRYPSETWATVIKRVDQLKSGRFLAQFLRDPGSGPVRDFGSKDLATLIKTANNVASQGTTDTTARYFAFVNTVNVLDALSAFSSSTGWVDNKEHIDWLKKTGKDFHSSIRANSVPDHLRLAVYQAEEQVVSILLKALELNLRDFDALLGLVEMITADELRETPAVRAHIYQHIICSQSIDLWRTVVLRSLEIYAGKTASQKTKWYLFHFMVNPIIAMDVMRHWNRGDYYAKGARLLDKTVIDSINTKIWRANLQDPQEDLLQPQVDHTRMEVLQLSAMLVKYHNTILQETRKDFIRFGWTYIRVEDIINKHAAYVVIGYFIAHYETPAKIANQIYFSLLKTNQTEGRHLVTQALELMAPVMPKHCNTLPGDRNAPWAVAPRRILAEESQNAQQMSSIFQFLVRHPALFYESRDRFAMLIITCLRKLAQPLPSVSHDNKKLTLNMMLLIWEWEQYRVEKKWTDPSRAFPASPSGKRQQQQQQQQQLQQRSDDNQQGATSPTVARQQQQQQQQASGTAPPPQQPQAAKAEYQIPVVGRAKMIKYLVEFIAQLHDRYPVPSNPPREQPPSNSLPMWSSDTCKKAMRLLYNLLQPQYWGDLDVDLFPNVTDVVLVGEKAAGVLSADKDKYDDRFMTNIVNTLQIVRVILHFKTDEWILKSLSQIQRILEKPLRSEHPMVQDCLHGADKTCDGDLEIKPMVQRILEAIPEDVPMEDAEAEGEAEAPTSEMVSFLSALATESMASANYVSGINIIWSLGRRQPTAIDNQTDALMKSLQSKLARDHISHYTHLAQQAAGVRPNPQDPNGAPTELTPYELEVQTGLIIKAIEIVAMRMEILGDRRRQFLSVIATLVEKSLSVPLCEKMLDMVEGWALRPDSTWPTLKEKTAVLNKMVAFEHRQDQSLLMKFLDLVIRIYEDPKAARTELTVRMEAAFLIGTRAQDVEMRNRFMSLFDKCLPKAASARLAYVILSQNWDTLADTYWLAQASQILMGGIDTSPTIQLNADDFRTFPASLLFGIYAKDAREPTAMADDKYEAFMANHRRFVAELGDVRVRDILDPLTQLQHVNSKLSHDLWIALFPPFWYSTVREERSELERGLVTLLTKDWHNRQMDKRPNVVQTMLTGAAMVSPDCMMPPHVVKFLAKTYDVWYTALHQLEKAAVRPVTDSKLVRESNLDALTDLYASLSEDDLFYGTWRRRCQFVETNAALSFEQNGLWDKAQKMYEAAQVKARTGVIPFSEAEYMLWEDHWIICAQKLQQWEILQEVAKMENFQDLILECAWRNPEYWHDQEKRDQLDILIKGVMDAPTPRRAFFQSFMYLLKLHHKQETLTEFQRVVDESIQLSIRKWHQLPRRLTGAHISLLQNFQQLVEFHDASIICQSLAATDQSNLDHKSSEVKVLMSSWRDRLPNMWDDIIAWQDLVTWRQHIFALINETYLRLLPPTQGQNAGGASYAYRGFHETAWIINRFAHVARKHSLPEVCVAQLSRIYTLPNIEIQEAFLKLREQAKCHYQNPDELTMGLEVINNTNLNYFSSTQKAEFFTLKGMFLEKLGQKDEADNAYSSALYHDVSSAKAWAEWGYFNDRRFKENPKDLHAAKQAVTSYLQAASSYKNHKSRKLIARILWLLSLDDADGTIASGFDDFKAEILTWYWITFIPQLLTGLGHNEAPRVSAILAKIAKKYPQALYFQLRTNREDMLQIKKNHENQNRRRAASQGQGQGQGQGQAVASNKLANAAAGSQQGKQDAAAKGNDSKAETTPNGEGGGDNTSANNGQGPSGQVKPEIKIEGPDGQSSAGGTPVTPAPPSAISTTSGSSSAVAANNQSRQNLLQAALGAQKKQPWDLTEEIMSTLKTGSPLLALTMETMVDQISKHFKCPPDEDAYRLIVALLNDGLAYVSRQPTSYAKDVRLPPATEGNITRFADSILPPHIRGTFEEDFVMIKPTMYEYIHKLRKWRDKFEEKLDRRPAHAPLESFSHYSPPLSEFRHLKFDDVEVPGQYLQHKDKNQDFVRIDRFMPNVDLVRGIGSSHRRLKIRGHDGSVHAFAVQHPAARHCRREERTLQLFRQLNQTLASKKESRKRDLQFTLPVMVPLAPHIRMVQEDTSYVTLQAVYEDHCRNTGMSKDEPVLFTMEKLRALSENKGLKPADHAVTARVEVLKAIQAKFVSQTTVLDYFQSIFPDFAEFWLFRRRFSYQLAAHTFMTYILHIDKRYPHKINIARGSGNIWGSELMPVVSATRPFFHNPEPVPFRLTPTLQTLMGPLATEGIFSCSIMAMARCLTEPEFRLEHALTLYVRDEMMLWFTSNSQHHTRAAAVAAHAQAQAAQQQQQAAAAAAAASSATVSQANAGKAAQPAQPATPMPAPAPPAPVPPPPASAIGPQLTEKQLRESVQANSDLIVKKAVALAHAPQGNLPANQTVIDLIAMAVNPMHLAMCDVLWMPYL